MEQHPSPVRNQSVDILNKQSSACLTSFTISRSLLTLQPFECTLIFTPVHDEILEYWNSETHNDSTR